MNDAQFDRLHDKIDAYTMEVDRFHDDVADLGKQIANADKLVRLANSSLGQIDQRIADAVQISAQSQRIADAAAVEASQAATAAASAAVSNLIGAMTEATEAARKTGTALNILQFKTGWWIAFYAAVTVLCCVASGYLTAWAMRGNALTPEQAHYVELGKAHEALLGNASDKELKLITTIRTRPAKTK